MKEKVLMIATVPSMIGQFNMNNIHILSDMDYEVHVACDWTDRSVWTNDKIENLKQELEKLNVKYIQIDYSRSMFNISNHLNSYKQTLSLLRENHYKFIHCHTPIASAIARIACKKASTKCIYTAHGFHFFQGAPLKNWLLFYPIEKWLSRYTDVLITINKEDYERAKNHFYCNNVINVPGVGVNTDMYTSCKVNRNQYREKLGIAKNSYLILSVGELNANKNHIVIIKAIEQLKMKKIQYIIAGEGEKKEFLLRYINEHNLADQIKILGFRNDIPKLCKISDLFAFPSRREGLGLAAIEAMAAGLPIITSNVHGIKDYSIFGQTGYLYRPNDIKGFKDGINKLISNRDLSKKIGINNIEKSKFYDKKNVNKIMYEVYSKKY